MGVKYITVIEVIPIILKGGMAMITIRQDFLKKDHPYRPGTKSNMQYLTIHNTANPTSTARNERGWLDNPQNTRKASWHICLDEKEVVQAIPFDEVAWHAGTSEGNRTSIGLEVCESGDQKVVWQRATKLSAQLLHERKWGIDRLRTHHDWSKKDCPRLILPRWKEFVADVQKELDKLNKPVEPPKPVEPVKVVPKKLLRVQVGAFRIKHNAELLVRELKSKGFDAIVIYVDGLYKVQCGAFSVEKNAYDLKKKLEKIGYKPFVV